MNSAKPKHSSLDDTGTATFTNYFQLSHKILASSASSFLFTLFLVQKQRSSQYIVKLASDRAVASRALLLGTMLSCSGVGVLVGLIGTVTRSNSFRQFRETVDDFIGLKRDDNTDDSDWNFYFNKLENHEKEDSQ